MHTRWFWVAVLLSAAVHASLLGLLALSLVLRPRAITPPQVLVVRGTSDREGVGVEVVARNPGVLRQGDQQTAGGDGAPGPIPERPPELPAPAPVPAAAPPAERKP